MTIHSIGEFRSAPNRPGIRTRPLIATEHGFTSFFVAEFEMDEGASVPLHTHPIEEAVVVTEPPPIWKALHRPTEADYQTEPIAYAHQRGHRLGAGRRLLDSPAACAAAAGAAEHHPERDRLERTAR